MKVTPAKPATGAALPRHWRRIAAQVLARAGDAPPLLSQMQWDALAALQRSGLFTQLGSGRWRSPHGIDVIEPLTLQSLARRRFVDLSPTIDGARIATLSPAGRRALDKRAMAKGATRPTTTTPIGDDP